MTLRRYRANNDRLATVRGVHEVLPEHGVFHGGSVVGQPGRGRGCVTGSLPEGLRTLRRVERQPDGRWLAQDGDTKPLSESSLALPGAVAVLFRNARGKRRRRIDARVGRAGHPRAAGCDRRPSATAGSGLAEAAVGAARGPGALSL